MACMKLGSKSDVFQLEGQSWVCTSGLPSDVCVEVGETSFHLHKFPLLSRCKFPEKCIQEEEVWCVDELPGGAGSFLLVAKFCYDVKFEVTATNVVSLRCAAEYLEMRDDLGEGNLVSQTCSFLDHQVLKSWADTIHALETCEAEAVLPLSEELDIVSRCIDSLAAKACEDPSSCWPTQCPSTPAVWNGIHSTSEPCSPSENWWYDDVAVLSLPLFKRLIHAVTCKGMRPNRIAGSVIFYAKRYLPLNGRSSNSSFSQRNHESSSSDGEQTALVEEIIELLPDQKGATPTKFLLKLLKISIILDASSARREILERRIGAQLDDACLQDLLIPNTATSVETLYDVECVQRIVDHFLDIIHDHDDEDYENEHEHEAGSDDSLPQITVVANLLDAYLAEVASDVNLKLEDFVLLASSFPEYARSLDDGIYRAIDIYLKEHPWLTETERELLCRLMNCQKLSLEASTNAAQNEMLPLRVTMQVLFFEQIRLRSYMAGWFVVAGTTLETNERTSTTAGDHTATLNDVRERVCRLEKKCDTMKHDIRKIVKTKGRWINFYKRFGLKVRTKSFDLKSSNEPNCNAH